MKRCKAITQDGTRCKRAALPRSLYCWQHKPKPRPSKKTKAKISKGLKKYHRRIKQIQEEIGLKKYRSARHFYETRERVKRDRYKRIVIAPGEDKPKFITKSELDAYGKKMKWGKDKGKTVIYYDTVEKEAVGGKHALRQRRKLQVERFGNKMLERGKTEQRYFVEKFWPKRAKKRGYLTKKESERVALKVLRSMRKDRELAKRVKDVFDEYPYF